jgi:Domain of unknown function (DUF1840)
VNNMLVRFSSIKTESITMFGAVAVELIKMMGSSGTMPGAIRAKDIPTVVARLRQALQVHALPPTPHHAGGGSGDDAHDPPVNLATRAAPLIDLLQRAAAGKAPLMWEVG